MTPRGQWEVYIEVLRLFRAGDDDAFMARDLALLMYERAVRVKLQAFEDALDAGAACPFESPELDRYERAVAAWAACERWRGVLDGAVAALEGAGVARPSAAPF